jgi:hypothetical protein
MSGFQKNGLPVEVKKFDTIGSHEWVDTSTWPASDDSKWTLEPAPGEAIKLTEVMVVFSEDAIMHEGGDLVVEFWIDALPDTPVFSYAYRDFRDWFARAFQKTSISYQGITMMQFDIPFSQPPTLWSSTGLDAVGIPKLNKMTVRIADDMPYRTSEGGDAHMARAKYVAEVYQDPDYVES